MFTYANSSAHFPAAYLHRSIHDIAGLMHKQVVLSICNLSSYDMRECGTIDSKHNGIGDYNSRNTILRGASALQYLAAWLQLTTARNG